MIELAIANAGTWAIGYQDECWWSRVASPALHSFSEEGKSLRLIEHSVAKDDPDPKAISCNRHHQGASTPCICASQAGLTIRVPR